MSATSSFFHRSAGASARWRRGKPGPETGTVGGVHASDDSAMGKAVAPELVASVLPPAMLQQDEIVLLLVKPSLWFILLTSLRFILIAMLTGMLVVKMLRLDSTTSVTPPGVATAAALAAVGRLVWALLVWTSHIYLLTNQRIVTIKGVVNVAISQANLRKIQRTELYRPWVERLFGLGTIGFATAATNTFDSSWVMVGRPVETHETIVAAINKVQGGHEV